MYLYNKMNDKFDVYSLMPDDKKLYQYRVQEIIQIPESLYLLSLIEQEKFSLIGDKDVSEKLSLFKLEQIPPVDLETLQMLDKGIAPGYYSKAIEKAQNHAHILKLILK